MSCYGSRINETPNLDRIAEEGMRLDNCFCTNFICAPSRASILTCLYNHENGVKTLGDKFDSRQPTVQRILRANGNQTALFGKWHLGHGGHHNPADFDQCTIFRSQGLLS
ncbi:sulfatase-like hydrolase/transferase [Sutcliffiella sp. NPDC057660]|uniref:sulfatase-like hydrolase/transferase n=1 Tax=Sutcliffiella sp. NPDC057660 TaxID=3346199 RepID=UPI0036D170B3